MYFGYSLVWYGDLNHQIYFYGYDIELSVDTERLLHVINLYSRKRSNNVLMTARVSATENADSRHAFVT